MLASSKDRDKKKLASSKDHDKEKKTANFVKGLRKKMLAPPKDRKKEC